ncbi:MAG TPA: heavy metal-associated domain-containing protein [Candidatus Nanoarchaeia archaeon]|nr:heavy metal-associated domain-containing protein [Candidatus Nanoarchaeia archaeon]
MKTEFTVKGTHCQACKMLIEDICSEIEGIKSCKVDFKTGKVVIEHDNMTNINQAKQEIEKGGNYKVMIQ